MINVITWKVYAGKREYTLTEDQYKFVEEQAKAGKSFVWFETFVLSIPHITSMERNIEHKDDTPKLAEVTVPPKEASKRIEAIKNQIKVELPKGMSVEEEEKRRAELKTQAEKLT